MRKLKIGIVGTGKIFEGAHAPGWLANPDVEIAALCDTHLPAAQAQAERLGVRRVYSSYEEMLEQEELDAIDICTPNIYHSGIAVAALDRGLHVFSEKPDAISPSEARRMADAAQRAGKVLMAMRNNRFTPQARFLKAYIDTGAMGEIYTARAGWLRRRGIPGRGGWFTTKALSGGGPLIDLGVHMLDVAIWLMGNPRPIAVSGATYTKFADSTIAVSPDARFGTLVEGGTFDVEDLATGFIRFDNGASLQLEFSWAANVEEDIKFVELRGTQAGCSLRNAELKLMTELAGALCDIAPRLTPPHELPHARNIHHFVDCMLGRSQPLYTPEEGVDRIAILGALYESAGRGREVRLGE
ncbi:Gfo/Idh/MocA family oxidoreductase [Paenibacillus sp. IB182496]|uniref:Gfo/Idh/MocA family oxidoreductase n=1 Tax=Paenibacillus sabuli TaxID=2772509 RepID=A0A927BT60_9BACL|nr:Gfo/Idh/MocA family oxidoreductase [Paenibacillus sabuli]MBD2846327.1 Gfo/Idh/MocA family oxidoreductase [Paenibacillus sabuli]